MSNLASDIIVYHDRMFPKVAPKSETEFSEFNSYDYKVPIEMYYQTDPNWATYKYGGYDNMSTHGCGPTVLSMVVTALTDTPLTPPQAADFSSANGYFSRSNGSAHALIPNGSEHFGLKVEFLPSITFKSCQYALMQDKLIVMLVGPGDFTTGGHFILIHGYTADAKLYVADPASYENTAKTWDIERLTSQLATWASDSGPVWIISK